MFLYATQEFAGNIVTRPSQPTRNLQQPQGNPQGTISGTAYIYLTAKHAADQDISFKFSVWLKSIISVV